MTWPELVVRLRLAREDAREAETAPEADPGGRAGTLYGRPPPDSVLRLLPEQPLDG